MCKIQKIKVNPYIKCPDLFEVSNVVKQDLIYTVATLKRKYERDFQTNLAINRAADTASTESLGGKHDRDSESLIFSLKGVLKFWR